MKPFLHSLVLCILSIVIYTVPVLGQVEQNPFKEPGRKYPPEPPVELFILGGNTDDAPAGSISVAEDPVYNGYTPEQLVQMSW
ncbi:MAG: hypothetical protein IPN29_02250 [Saprospiraceae bacterium]|nr:hypothetical protein [Saprospiraceae bacterium]